MKVLSGDVRVSESRSSTDKEEPLCKTFELAKEKHMEKITSGKREKLEDVMALLFITGVFGNEWTESSGFCFAYRDI